MTDSSVKSVDSKQSDVVLARAIARAECAEHARDNERWMRLRLESAVKRHLELQKQLQQLQNRRRDEHHLISSDYVTNMGNVNSKPICRR